MSVSKKILVINCGSSTVKADVFAVEKGIPVFIAKALADKIGKADANVTIKTAAGKVHKENLTQYSVAAAVSAIAQGFARAKVCSTDDIVAVGHRVVHGGARFSAPVRIDAEVIAAIRDMEVFAPLHNFANLEGIEFCTQNFVVPQVAVFDTAFHQTMPPMATAYAIPKALSEKYALRRYGFHGTSHEYVTRECARRMQLRYEDFNAISLHLGNGASACCVRGGKSVDTSMGFTPLEGLVMGTRSGDIDPSVAFFLQNVVGLSAHDAEALLNHDAGLKGLAGTSDMRELLSRAEAKEATAELAIEIFCTRIRKYIGAYLTWGRPHALIFTGGIGENSSEIRRRILMGLSYLGIEIDEENNSALPVGGLTSVKNSLAVYVINTDEESMIARETMALVEVSEN